MTTDGHINNAPLVAVLFARRDSVYKMIRGCDVYDLDRDARTFAGGLPVIAHPPCRAWGRLRHFARPRPGELDLARLAVDMVRAHGGVLEHPSASRLWPDRGLPDPGRRDAHGGWTLSAPQWLWGHRADKPTWFYFCGLRPGDLPPIPIRAGGVTHVVQSRKRRGARPHISRAEREQTPPALARWLVESASICVHPCPSVGGNP